MPIIKFENINKVYPNNVQAVFDFNLEIQDKEFVVLVGPSGCGKSTTLRMLAGLEDITDGKIYIGEQCINEVEAKDRNIAMVFQNYALYPHMTVYDNMAFSLKIRKKSTPALDENGNQMIVVDKEQVKQLKKDLAFGKKTFCYDPRIAVLDEENRKLDIYASVKKKKKGKEILVVDKKKIAENKKKIRVLVKENKKNLCEECRIKFKELEDQIAYLEANPSAPAVVLSKYTKQEIDEKIQIAAEKLGLVPYLKRKPAALSGGQRQRVALGRAIVRHPNVFLMDEPLSNLDAKLRVQMRSELIKIHKAANTTTVYVTHDQTEAMTMADRIVVMKDGWIQQIGTPKEIYNTPANVFVAGFIGSPSMNFLRGKLIGSEFVIEKKKKEKEFRIELGKDIAKKLKEYQDKEIIFGIRPEDIAYVSDKREIKKSDFVFDMECDIRELLGYEYIIYGYIAGQRVIAKTSSDNEVEEKASHEYAINMNKIHIFDGKTEKIIY